EFPALATGATDPPAWLQGRPNTDLHMVHGGRGYALLPHPGTGGMSCEQRVDVLSPNGNACVSVTFVQPQGQCVAGAVTVGYDGTVIQQMKGARPDAAH